jgi:hypothetical protein
MKSASEDGGACWRKWYRTHSANLLRLSGPPPKNIRADQLKLTILCRYVGALLKNQRVFRYLGKYHSIELRQLQSVLADFERRRHTPPDRD